MKYSLILLLVILCTGCKTQEKQYYVVFEREELSLGGYKQVVEEVDSFSATSDSLAYMQAAKKYFIRKNTYSMVRNGIADTYLRFSLLNTEKERVIVFVPDRQLKLLEADIKHVLNGQ